MPAAIPLTDLDLKPCYYPKALLPAPYVAIIKVKCTNLPPRMVLKGRKGPGAAIRARGGLVVVFLARQPRSLTISPRSSTCGDWILLGRTEVSHVVSSDHHFEYPLCLPASLLPDSLLRASAAPPPPSSPHPPSHTMPDTFDDVELRLCLYDLDTGNNRKNFLKPKDLIGSATCWASKLIAHAKHSRDADGVLQLLNLSNVRKDSLLNLHATTFTLNLGRTHRPRDSQHKRQSPGRHRTVPPQRVSIAGQCRSI